MTSLLLPYRSQHQSLTGVIELKAIDLMSRLNVGWRRWIAVLRDRFTCRWWIKCWILCSTSVRSGWLLLSLYNSSMCSIDLCLRRLSTVCCTFWLKCASCWFLCWYYLLWTKTIWSQKGSNTIVGLLDAHEQIKLLILVSDWLADYHKMC